MGADVRRVQEGVEGLPSGQGEVGFAGGTGMCGAALGAPAQLFCVGQVAQVVDGHQGSWQGELVAWELGGQQSPGPGRAGGGEDGMGAAVTVAGLCHAAQIPERAFGQVTAQQQLHDGAVRFLHADGEVAAGGRGRGEGTGVDHAAAADGELAADRLDVRTGPAGGRAARAEHGVRDTAPGAAVAVRISDAAAQVPAAGFGDVGGG